MSGSSLLCGFVEPCGGINVLSRLYGKWRSLIPHEEHASAFPLMAEDNEACDGSTERLAAFADIISWDCMAANISCGHCVRHGDR